MAEEKGTNIVMEGRVKFNNKDPLVGRFELEPSDNYLGNRRFDIPGSLFPEDFDSQKYDVKGQYSIKINIKPK